MVVFGFGVRCGLCFARSPIEMRVLVYEAQWPTCVGGVTRTMQMLNEKRYFAFAEIAYRRLDHAVGTSSEDTNNVQAPCCCFLVVSPHPAVKMLL